MNEVNPERREQEPLAKDAAQLADLYYFSSLKAIEADSDETTDMLDMLGAYIGFRAEQDPNIGHMIVAAFESFRDPEPASEDLEGLQSMQEQANSVRTRLGLPALDIPTELPAADTNWSPDRPY